jgi:phosphatidylserine decarboxylase
MIRIHREGIGIIKITALLSAALVVISTFIFEIFVFVPVLIGITFIMVLIFRFFRIPKRQFITNENAVIAPADGKIVAIEQVMEKEYFNDNRTLVSIFMSIHNVHINWFPVSGKVKYFKYHPGKYLLARHPKSSELNERTTVVIDSGIYQIMVRQVAGYVARRVVCYASPGKLVNQSQEMGFIKFGSRLDIYLPADIEIPVKIGERTIGGVTVIGK